MTSSTRLPTVWPSSPLSQPGMTWLGDLPMVKPNGALRCHEESKVFLLFQIRPTYWVTTVWPLTIAGPDPLIRVFAASVPCGDVEGIDTDGTLPSCAPTVGRPLPPPDTCCPEADAFAAKFLIRSTTKTRVSVGFIPACVFPWLPYASFGGMTTSTRLPIFLPRSPVSRPGRSWPENTAGLPLVQVLCASLCVLPLQM